MIISRRFHLTSGQVTEYPEMIGRCHLLARNRLGEAPRDVLYSVPIGVKADIERASLSKPDL